MTLFTAFGQFAAAGAAAEDLTGFFLITPTSIANSSGSASINANGSVSFSGVTSISMNDVFTSRFDNYLVLFGPAVLSSGNVGLNTRLRAAGSDATGTNYVYELLNAESTSILARRDSSQTRWLTGYLGTEYDGNAIWIYQPNLAVPTTFSCTGGNGYSQSTLLDTAGTHSLSTAYDGVSLSVGSGNMTGLVAVYGLGA